MYDVNQLTQTEARAWLMYYDEYEFWVKQPLDTDFVFAAYENVRDFGPV